jgi:Cu(I)/Ag(I) efflux system membrane fusion protein
MDLVAVESMGYTIPDDTSPPLVIPESAVLITGKRAVVYVEVPDKDKPTFEGREIVLGAKAGDYYIVKEGLEEGDSVVTSGNFKIDSALQIQAKPSMMSPVNNKK